MSPVQRMGSLAAVLLTLALAGCATADPTSTVATTAESLADRGVTGVEWRRSDEAEQDAIERARVLLAEPLTTTSAAEVAILRSPELQAELAELGVARADLAQASRLANPGLSVALLRGSGQEQVTAGLFANVVDWLTQPLRRRLAEAELERVKLAVGAAILGQVTAAEMALVELQAAEALVARLGVIAEIDRAAASYATALQAAGNLTSRDRANAEAGWAETRAELGRARADAARKREAVVRTLGLAGDESWSAAPLVEPPPGPTLDLAELERVAVRDRLELAAARWAIESLERARTLRRRTRWLPVGLDLGVEREREVDGVTLRGPTLELALPIFDSGKASIARYDAEIARANSQLVALDLAVRSQVREKAGDLAAQLELATLYRETVLPLRREVLELTIREYNQMLVGTFGVLIAKQEEIAAEKRYFEAVAGAWSARLELDRALGTLSTNSEGRR